MLPAQNDGTSIQRILYLIPGYAELVAESWGCSPLSLMQPWMLCCNRLRPTTWELWGLQRQQVVALQPAATKAVQQPWVTMGDKFAAGHVCAW
jgi:hypothetical protein